jgi:hypothetical protein
MGAKRLPQETRECAHRCWNSVQTGTCCYGARILIYITNKTKTLLLISIVLCNSCISYGALNNINRLIFLYWRCSMFSVRYKLNLYVLLSSDRCCNIQPSQSLYCTGHQIMQLQYNFRKPNSRGPCLKPLLLTILSSSLPSCSYQKDEGAKSGKFKKRKMRCDYSPHIKMSLTSPVTFLFHLPFYYSLLPLQSKCFRGW